MPQSAHLQNLIAIAKFAKYCNFLQNLQLHVTIAIAVERGFRVTNSILTEATRTTMDVQARPTPRALVASLRQYMLELTPEARGMVTVNKLREALACRLGCDERMVSRTEIRRNLHDIVEMLEDDLTSEKRRLSALRASMRPADGKVEVNGTRKRIRLNMQAAAEFNRLVSAAHTVEEEARVTAGLPLSLWWRIEASSPTFKSSPVDMLRAAELQDPTHNC